MGLRRLGLSILILLCPIVFASGLSDASEPLEIYDLLPREASRSAAIRQAGKSIQQEVDFAPPERLLEHIRWVVPTPETGGCVNDASFLRGRIVSAGLTPPPTTNENLFPVLLDHIRKLVLHLRLDEARETVEFARRYFACVDNIFVGEQLSTLFVLEGVLRFYQRDGQHLRSFLNALAIDPAMTIEASFPPRVQAAFQEAVASVDTLALVKVKSAGQQFYADGQLRTSDCVLRAGSHLFQLEGPGRSLRTVLVEVPPTDEAISLETLTDFGLPKLSGVKQALLEGLSNGQLDAFQAQGIEHFLNARREDVIRLATMEGGALLLWEYRSRTGLRQIGSHRGALQQNLPRTESSSRKALEKEQVAQERQPLGVSPRMQLGGGLAWTHGGFPPNALVELSAVRSVASNFQVGITATLHYERAQLGGATGLRTGLMAGYRVETEGGWWLFPAVGYGGGAAPTAILDDCTARVADGGEVLECGHGGDSNISASVRVWGHGPLLRFEMGTALRWAAGWQLLTTLQSHFVPFAWAPGGSGHYSDASEPVGLEISDAAILRGIRLDALAGVMRTF